MKCIIVDDEPLAREGLELKIQKVGFLELTGQFHNGMDAYNFLISHPVDLIFLDIQMPDITGIDLIRSMKNPPLVIITSAYSEYALESFELDAVDYIVKPIEYQRFIKSVNKAKEIFDLRQHNPLQLEKIQDDYIYIRSDRQFIKVFFKDIRYIEGMKNYAQFHTDKDRFMTPISLQQVQDQLPSTMFARVNKSFIINIQFISRITQDYILIEEKKEIPFGKSYQEDFVNQFIKGNLLGRKP